MKRFAIFALVGPLIGLTVILAVVVSQGTAFKTAVTPLPATLLLTYVSCLVPLLIVAVLDWSLGRIGAGYRIALCALGGFLGFWWLSAMVAPSNTPWHFLAIFDIAGAISAAACSWLSNHV